MLFLSKTTLAAAAAALLASSSTTMAAPAMDSPVQLPPLQPAAQTDSGAINNPAPQQFQPLPPQQQTVATSGNPTAANTAAGAALSTASAQSTVTFVNQCSKNVMVKYRYHDTATGRDILPAVFGTLSPRGGSQQFQVTPDGPRAALNFVSYFVGAPGKSEAICPDCTQWNIGNMPFSSSTWWANGANAKYAAFCNPALAAQKLSYACCDARNPSYNAALNDCVNNLGNANVNDMGFGTHVEFTFSTPTFAQDSIDISTNYNTGNIFYNIPVSISSTQQCNHAAPGTTNNMVPVPFPWACNGADCKTAYQTPTDVELNGAQIQCPGNGATSYTVTYCPAGSADPSVF